MGNEITLPVNPDQDGTHFDGVAGKVIRTAPFKDYDFIPENFDKFWEQLLRFAKAPPLPEVLHMYKEVVVDGDDAEFEVKIVLHADRVKQLHGMESPSGADRIHKYFKHTFNKEARTIRSEAFDDYWADEKPAPTIAQLYMKIGDPMDIEYYMVAGDTRLAGQGLIDTVIMPILRIVQMGLNPGRSPDVKLRWDEKALCHYTGPLDSLASRDALFDGLLAAARKACVPPALPDFLEGKQETEDRYTICIKESPDVVTGELVCEHDKGAGSIYYKCSSPGIPNVRFEISESPLTIRSFAKQKDDTNFASENIYAERFAQIQIDAAIKACESWF